jgi:hypothetical protein
MNKIHELKTWPDVFQEVLDDLKVHEFRNNDRGFKSGDYLHLREFNPVGEVYTGRSISVIITSISYGPEWGIPEGYAVMSIRKVTK